MHIKSVRVPIFGLMVFLLASGVSAGAQELTKEAKAERILAVTKADLMMDQVFNQVKTVAASLMPPDATPEQRAKAQETQAKLIDLVKTLTARMRPHQIKVYTDNFSDKEISDLLAFFESSTGRLWIEKMPLIMSQLMSATQGELKDFQSEVQRVLNEGAKN